MSFIVILLSMRCKDGMKRCERNAFCIRFLQESRTCRDPASLCLTVKN